MPVIAMTREMGSGGRELAQRVADALGLSIVLHELVESDLAHRMQVPESAIRRCFEGGASLGERWQVGTRRLARFTAAEVLELARKGNALIRGWGACVLLRGVPHVVRVRVCAPMELRERAVMQRHGLRDRQAARLEIARNDAAHARTLHAAFAADRRDSLLYDLVLNTERLSMETCVKLVCDLAATPEFQETAQSRAILDDKALEARIRLALRERFTAGTGVGGIEVAVRSGRVVLEGAAIHTTLAEEAGRIAGAVAGVSDVANRIEIVRGPRGL
jgi:cytidylate kinase